MRKSFIYPSLFLSVLLHTIWLMPGIKTPVRPDVSPSSSKLMLDIKLTHLPKLELEKTEHGAPAEDETPNVAKISGRNSKKIPDTWTSQVRKQFQRLAEQQTYYPQEAIRQNLEGVVSVLVILDNKGIVVASRVEEASGHPLLDQAALKAVRLLKPLGSDAPREFVLPVVFKLH